MGENGIHNSKLFESNNQKYWKDYIKEGDLFKITKRERFTAYKFVRTNKGAWGIDGINFKKYEKNLGSNLYKIWSRMSSGNYWSYVNILDTKSYTYS